jgi:hypothetical protein
LVLCWTDFCFTKVKFCFSQTLHLTKSRIDEKSAEVQQTVRVAELEEANAQLHVELNASQSKLSEVEHREHALTFAYEDLKKDFDEVRSSHVAMVKGKADLEKTEGEKVRRFQNSLLKKLAELCRDTEASVAALEGRCVEFLADASISELLEWFRAEVAAMPTAFTECNKNITCYMLIGIFKMLVGEWCEHLLELMKLALSCDASLLQDFLDDLDQIAKMHVKNWWIKHGLPCCMQKIEEENQVSFVTLYFVKAIYVV